VLAAFKDNANHEAYKAAWESNENEEGMIEIRSFILAFYLATKVLEFSDIKQQAYINENGLELNTRMQTVSFQLELRQDNPKEAISKSITEKVKKFFGDNYPGKLKEINFFDHKIEEQKLHCNISELQAEAGCDWGDLVNNTDSLYAFKRT
jgi:hypothetical protein